MGRQVNFYMGSEDLVEFEQMLKKRGGISFIPYELSREAVEAVPTLLLAREKSGTPSYTMYLARESDLGNIRQFYHVAIHGYWFVNELNSPVVEMAKSFVQDQMIRRGRLYFNTGYYDQEDHWVEKSKEFIRWADSLLRWIRSHYVIERTTGWYIGPQAQQMVDSGEYTLNPI
jgi:hypothetical protein